NPVGRPLLTSELVAACVACSSDGTGPGNVAFTWSARSALPLPRTDFGAAVVGANVYALAGFSGSTLARVDEYDPATDTWTRRADMLTPSRHFVAGGGNGQVYFEAGMSTR